jgi:hypothetical protein
VSLEEELQRIEHEIRKLKIQFDLYFVGANPKPPNDQRDALDKMIKKYQGVHMKNIADRFLYNSIVNKFNAYSELWSKSLRVREEGARVHPLAARAAHQSVQAETGGSNGAAPRAAAGRAARGRSPEGVVSSWKVSATARDEIGLRKLYDSFIAAKSQVGDERKPTFDAFAREIARHAAALKGKADCEAIDFKIYCKDNKVSLKAKPSK